MHLELVPGNLDTQPKERKLSYAQRSIDYNTTYTDTLLDPPRLYTYTRLPATQPYGDLLLVVALLGATAPPAGLPALGGLLLAPPPAGLPAPPLRRLPLRMGLPAGSPTTSLRCHGA